jgi:hypothetical protein
MGISPPNCRKATSSTQEGGLVTVAEIGDRAGPNYQRADTAVVLIYQTSPLSTSAHQEKRWRNKTLTWMAGPERVLPAVHASKR